MADTPWSASAERSAIMQELAKKLDRVTAEVQAIQGVIAFGASPTVPSPALDDSSQKAVPSIWVNQKIAAIPPSGGGASVYKAVSSAAPLADAITFATDNPSILVKADLRENTAISDAKSFPSNFVFIKSSNGSKLMFGATGSIDFAGIGLDNPMSDEILFSLPGGLTQSHLHKSGGTTQINESTGLFTTLRMTAPGGVITMVPTAHLFTTGQRVRYYSEAPYSNLSVSSDYFVVVIDATTYKLATSRANALAGTTINSLSGGVANRAHIISAMPVKWTNANDHPKSVSTKMFATANGTFGELVNAASSALHGKTGATIYAIPRPFNSVPAVVAKGQTLRSYGGDSVSNSFDHIQSYPITLEKDAKVIGDMPIFYESAAPGVPRMVGAFDATVSMGHVQVSGLHIKKNPIANHNDSQHTISIGNVESGLISHNKIEGVVGYCIQAGDTNPNGVRAQNVEICFNWLINCQTQNMFTPTSINTRWHHNILDYRGMVSGNLGTCMDFESNNPPDSIELLEVTDNVLLFPLVPAIGQRHGIAILPARSAGVKTAIIARNHLISSSYTPGQAAPLATGIYANGVEDLRVYDNYVVGAYKRAYGFQDCKKLRFYGNEAQDCGTEEQKGVQYGAIAMLSGCTDSVIKDNFHNVGTGTGRATKIVETSVHSYYVSSGSVLYPMLHVNVPYKHWVGQKYKYNSEIYTVISFALGTNPVNGGTDPCVTVDRSIGTVTAKTFAPGDITTGTGVISIPNHPFKTGALGTLTNTTDDYYAFPPFFGNRVTMANGPAAESWVEIEATVAPTVPVYIRSVTTGTITLHPTEADALANTNVITYSNAGGGTHILSPILVMVGMNNKFIDNGAPVTLAPEGTSKVVRTLDGIGELLNFESWTSPIALSEADSGKIFPDAGKLTTSYLKMPPNPKDGTNYTFLSDSGGGIKVFAGQGSRFTVDGVITNPNGTIELNSVNSNIKVYARNGNWKTMWKEGTVTRGDVSGSPIDTNFAAASQGATAYSATVEHTDLGGGLDLVAMNAINGNLHTSNNWLSGTGGFWSGGAGGGKEVEIIFSEAKTIDEIGIVFLSNTNDGLNYNVAPAVNTNNTLSAIGVTSYEVFYWSGSAWVEIADVTSNTKAHPVHSFLNVTTTKIKVNCRASGDNYMRIVEVQAHLRTA